MVNELTLLVSRALLFTSFAIVLVLLVRRPLRHWLGAATAYQSWLIVPCATTAALLPSGAAPVIRMVPVLQPIRVLAEHTTPVTAAPADALLVLWACGMVLMAAQFIAAHYKFLRQAGHLTACQDWYVSAGDVGPASVGLFRPRIFVPSDFTRRCSALEQVLIVAHERAHIDRRDAIGNLLCAMFQCVFWFNPLCHFGARRFRQDQEIACDALVMASHPHQRRAYAHALLKFHTGASAVYAGINCHWQTNHPTKERIMSLHLSAPGIARRLAGRCIVVVLAAGAMAATLGARAEQVATASTYSVALTFDAGAEHAEPRVLAKAGEAFAVASGDWRIELTVRPAQSANQVWLAGKLIKNDKVVGAPTILARLGDKATVKAGDGDQALALSMVVSKQP
ncbi:M56 family metallopeptidase [Massilia sp. CMS3.1]|uniref:M56 family metallopeptidase n=1 Tax=Massilia sp. CMS3.1 TaxID=3373083 RepID=UPI003EE4E594